MRLNYRVHRLKTATFLRTFSHDGIFGSACWWWGPLHSSHVAPSAPFSARLARYVATCTLPYRLSPLLSCWAIAISSRWLLLSILPNNLHYLLYTTYRKKGVMRNNRRGFDLLVINGKGLSHQIRSEQKVLYYKQVLVWEWMPDVILACGRQPITRNAVHVVHLHYENLIYNKKRRRDLCFSRPIQPFNLARQSLEEGPVTFEQG